MFSALSSGVLYLIIGIVPLMIVLIGKFLYPTFYNHNQGNFISALIMMKTPVFVQVIYFGALISALLSTASGAILAPATVLAENVIRRFYPNYDLLRIMRWSVVGIAFVSVCISLSNKSIFELAGLASAFSLVSVFIPFTATLFYKGTTSSGVILAMIIGITGWSVAEFFEIDFPSFFIGMFCSMAGLMIGIFYDRNFKIQS
jgi:Na+/proline symporter